MTTLMVQTDTGAVPLADCRWVRVAPTGCATASLLGDRAATAEAAQKELVPRRRDRDREDRLGTRYELLTREQWQERAKQCLLGQCTHPPAPDDAPRGRPLAPCGTTSAYYRHLRHHETPCDPCRAANREEKRAQADSGVKRPDMLKPIAHGTTSGYQQHRYRGEEPCDACRGAVRTAAPARTRERPATPATPATPAAVREQTVAEAPAAEQWAAAVCAADHASGPDDLRHVLTVLGLDRRKLVGETGGDAR